MPLYLESTDGKESLLAAFFCPPELFNSLEDGKVYELYQGGKKKQLRAVWYGKRDNTANKDS